MPSETQPLDERLIEVALKLLETEGPEQLTLRRVAREAGVSHGAPLRHFATLADLKAEVAARGFRLLHDAVADASRSLPPGAGGHARIRAACVAYVQAAVAHPNLFALMFRTDALDPNNERFLQEAPAAFEQVVRLAQAAQDAGYEPDAESRALAGAVWAQVHGLASLWSQGAYPGVVPDTRLDEALDLSLRLLGLGESGGTP